MNTSNAVYPTTDHFKFTLQLDCPAATVQVQFCLLDIAALHAASEDEKVTDGVGFTGFEGVTQVFVAASSTCGATQDFGEQVP